MIHPNRMIDPNGKIIHPYIILALISLHTFGSNWRFLGASSFVTNSFHHPFFVWLKAASIGLGREMLDAA